MEDQLTPLKYPEDEKLTPRELEVLNLFYDNLLEKEVADVLHISLSTVKFHVGDILSKLHAPNMKAAFKEARRRGLID